MTLRDQQLDQLDGGDFDVLVIGCGINGSASAAALVAHGFRVAIVDRADFGGATSQESSNLVWGGFKYLANYEFGLVRSLCRSRNRLMAAYPTSVVEKRFVVVLGATAPFSPSYATAGASAYWAIGGLRTTRPRRLSTDQIRTLEPIVDTHGINGGLEYADAYLPDNDARFVFGFVRRALDRGAVAANYVEVITAEHAPAGWRTTLRDRRSGVELAVTSRAIVNAAGPFADALNEAWGIETRHRILFSKGVHLVVDELTPSGRILAFFDDTGRLFYVIPMGTRSVIGTTDTPVGSPINEVTDDDRDFVLDQINRRLVLDTPLERRSVIGERCGVRPLVVEQNRTDHQHRDWTALSRRHAIEVNVAHRFVSIFGGKLTDCLNVGEEVVDACAEIGTFNRAWRVRWYGEPDRNLRTAFYAEASTLGLHTLSGAQPQMVRLWRRYGLRAFTVLDDLRAEPGLSAPVIAGTNVMHVEADHMARHEMVITFEDFLRRRTDLSLTTRDTDLRCDDGLLEVARTPLGNDAERRYVDQFGALPNKHRTAEVRQG